MTTANRVLKKNPHRITYYSHSIWRKKTYKKAAQNLDTKKQRKNAALRVFCTYTERTRVLCVLRKWHFSQETKPVILNIQNINCECVDADWMICFLSLLPCLLAVWQASALCIFEAGVLGNCAKQIVSSAFRGIYMEKKAAWSAELRDVW